MFAAHAIRWGFYQWSTPKQYHTLVYGLSFDADLINVKTMHRDRPWCTLKEQLFPDQVPNSKPIAVVRGQLFPPKMSQKT